MGTKARDQDHKHVNSQNNESSSGNGCFLLFTLPSKFKMLCCAFMEQALWAVKCQVKKKTTKISR